MAPIAPAATRWTAREYLRLVDRGVLGPDDRVELLRGVIVTTAPEGPRHAAIVNKIADALRGAIGTFRAAVRVQNPLRAGTSSVPEPDVAVVPGSHDDYFDAHPNEALLVVEVADGSLPQDRLTKAAIYADAGIPEYWIVNLRRGVVEVHRRPRLRAGYATTRIARRGERIRLVAVPRATVAVAGLLPPRALSSSSPPRRPPPA